MVGVLLWYWSSFHFAVCYRLPSGWGLLFYGGYKFFTKGKKDNKEEVFDYIFNLLACYFFGSFSPTIFVVVVDAGMPIVIPISFIRLHLTYHSLGDNGHNRKFVWLNPFCEHFFNSMDQCFSMIRKSKAVFCHDDLAGMKKNFIFPVWISYLIFRYLGKQGNFFLLCWNFRFHILCWSVSWCQLISQLIYAIVPISFLNAGPSWNLPPLEWLNPSKMLLEITIIFLNLTCLISWQKVGDASH